MSQTTDQKIDNLTSIITSLNTKVDTIQADVSDLKTDVSDLKTDVKIIKHVQGQQSNHLRHIQSDVNSLKSSMRSQVEETNRLGTLFEDFESRFEAAGELGT